MDEGERIERSVCRGACATLPGQRKTFASAIKRLWPGKGSAAYYLSSRTRKSCSAKPWKGGISLKMSRKHESMVTLILQKASKIDGFFLIGIHSSPEIILSVPVSLGCWVFHRCMSCNATGREKPLTILKRTFNLITAFGFLFNFLSNQRKL